MIGDQDRIGNQASNELDQTVPRQANVLYEDGLAYLLECFRTARAELLFRVRHRDYWLLIQLISQALLLALAQGVEIGGVTAMHAYPDFLALAAASSLVLATLYFVEDNLIGYLGRYISSISEAEAKLSQRVTQIVNWDSSPQVREYARKTLPVRFLGQMIAFFFIPAGLATYRFVNIKSWGALQVGELAVDISFLITILVIGSLAFRFRQSRRVAISPSVLIVSRESEVDIVSIPVSQERTTRRRGIIAIGIGAVVLVLLIVGALAVLAQSGGWPFH